MTLLRLALRDAGRSPFRAWAIGACAFVVGALGIATVLVTGGARQSFGRVSDRLGADVIVVPAGSEPMFEDALLMGRPTGTWMPASNVDAIRRIPGVEAATPQLYLASLFQAACCTVDNMFLVAFDPGTDFTVQPWIAQRFGASGLGLGDGIGGSLVSVPEGQTGITLYGYPLRLKATLAPTGTNLDRSLFITAATARDMASRSATAAVRPLVIPANSVSAVLVRVAPAVDAEQVAGLIVGRVMNVSTTTGPKLFGGFRQQLTAVQNGLIGVLGFTVGLTLAFIGLVSAMSAHERRRETGVLRALGVTRAGVVGIQVAQSAVLTATGGAFGMGAASLLIWLFRDLLVERLGFPFLFPDGSAFAALTLSGLALLVAGVSAAVAIPTLVAALGEPAATMRD